MPSTVLRLSAGRSLPRLWEVVPTTLAENAGLNSINVVTDLRNRHESGQKNSGVSVRRGAATDIYSENVLQPVLVSTSAITLAAQC